MRNQLFAVTLITTATLAVGCGRDKAQPPAAQVQSQTPAQQLNTPETVTGCLRAGDGPDTFVLTTSQTDDGRRPMTYEIAGTPSVNLTEHVGHRVSLQGIVREQQAATTATTSAPATDKPRGTSGTPTVQTSATLQVRRIEVSSVTRASGDCEK
jgi:hypothetical protein